MTRDISRRTIAIGSVFHVQIWPCLMNMCHQGSVRKLRGHHGTLCWTPPPFLRVLRSLHVKDGETSAVIIHVAGAEKIGKGSWVPPPLSRRPTYVLVVASDRFRLAADRVYAASGSRERFVYARNRYGSFLCCWKCGRNKAVCVRSTKSRSLLKADLRGQQCLRQTCQKNRRYLPRLKLHRVFCLKNGRGCSVDLVLAQRRSANFCSPLIHAVHLQLSPT